MNCTQVVPKATSTAVDVAAVQESSQIISPKSHSAEVPTSSGLDLSPRARALMAAQTYAETASSTMSPEAKLAVFHSLFDQAAHFDGPLFGHLAGRQVRGKLRIEHGGARTFNTLR